MMLNLTREVWLRVVLHNEELMSAGLVLAAMHIPAVRGCHANIYRSSLPPPSTGGNCGKCISVTEKDIKAVDTKEGRR